MEKKKNNDIYKIAVSPYNVDKLVDAGLSPDSSDMHWLIREEVPMLLSGHIDPGINFYLQTSLDAIKVKYTWSMAKLLTILEYPTLQKVYKKGWMCLVAVETRDKAGKFCIAHEGEPGPTAIDALVNMLLRALKEGHVDKKYLRK